MPERTEPSPPRFLDELVHLCAHLKKALPGESVPCFAHLRIEPAGAAGASRARDLLLGWRTVTSPEVTVLNWQTAPLAEVFFSCREGEEYELSVGGRELCGTVRARSLLTFQAGELVAVHTAGASFARRPGGAGQGGAEWAFTGAPPVLLQPRRGGSGRRQHICGATGTS